MEKIPGDEFDFLLAYSERIFQEKRISPGYMMAGKVPYRFALLLVGLLLCYTYNDYFPDDRVLLKEETLNDLKVLIAHDLVIQGNDDQNNIWATRGFWAYKKTQSEDFFTRQYHIPTSLSISWLGNFSITRWLISRYLWVELLPFADGKAIAVSDNRIWRRSTDGRFRQTFELKYPLGGVGGVGVGTGFLPSALLLTDDGRILFGEYWKNNDNEEVNIYMSHDLGSSWKKAYSFPESSIRHIHSLHQDPFTKLIWIATGDSDKQVNLYNTKNFELLNQVGNNSQKFRTIGLSFDSEYVYWGTDTEYDLKNSGLFRLNKKSLGIEKLSDVTGCIYMAATLQNSIIVMSEAREGGKIEPDDVISLYIIKHGTKIHKIPLDRWKKNIFFRTYSWARLARGRGLSSLYLTPLNTYKYNGMLMVIPQQRL